MHEPEDLRPLLGSPTGRTACTCGSSTGRARAARRSPTTTSSTPPRPALPAITAAPGAVGNGSSPAWSFTADAGAATECRLDRGATVVAGWAACSSPRGFGLGGEPDGDYVFLVRATDAAGNASAAATSAHRVDRVPPAPPTVTAGPGPLGRDRGPAWAFEAEPGASFECTLRARRRARRGLVRVREPARPSTSRPRPTVRSPSACAPATRRGTRARRHRVPYVLDTTPGAVTIEAGPGALGRDRAPAWRFSGEPDASFECGLALGELSVAAWGACASPRAFDLSGRPDGDLRLHAARDRPRRQPGPRRAAPTTSSTRRRPPRRQIDARPQSPGRDRTPTWRFTGEAGRDVLAAAWTARRRPTPASGRSARAPSPPTSPAATTGGTPSSSAPPTRRGTRAPARPTSST